MNKYVLAAMLCPMFGATAGAQSLEFADAAPSSRGLPGGYQPCPVDATVVEEAKTFVQRHFTSMTLLEVKEAYTQVVAGLNVRFTCVVQGDDGLSEWQFVAYLSLDKQWHLHSANRI
jgi:hypothetical protein